MTLTIDPPEPTQGPTLQAPVNRRGVGKAIFNMKKALRSLAVFAYELLTGSF
jgi:hypothetical protein